MRAHVDDLRAEVAKDTRFEGREPAAFAEDIAARGADAVADDPRFHGLLVHADKLARTPGAMGADDVESLRALGYDDRAIHDITQVVAYFSYINRIADGLGVDLEPEMRAADRA